VKASFASHIGKKDELLGCSWHTTLHVNANLQQWMQISWLDIDFGLKLLAEEA
jgi:hypothetical protein